MAATLARHRLDAAGRGIVRAVSLELPDGLTEVVEQVSAVQVGEEKADGEKGFRRSVPVRTLLL